MKRILLFFGNLVGAVGAVAVAFSVTGIFVVIATGQTRGATMARSPFAIGFVLALLVWGILKFRGHSAPRHAPLNCINPHLDQGIF